MTTTGKRKRLTLTETTMSSCVSTRVTLILCVLYTYMLTFTDIKLHSRIAKINLLRYVMRTLLFYYRFFDVFSCKWGVKNPMPDCTFQIIELFFSLGALLPCPECKTESLMYSSKGCYTCHGTISEWSKCIYTTKEPKRKKFHLPHEVEDILGV